MRYCLLDANSVVVNIVEADASTIDKVSSHYAVWASPAGIGSTYNATTQTFSAPASSSPRVISVYDFLQRFPQAKRIAIEASADTGVKDFMYLLERIDKQVHLDDPNTTQGVQYLVSQGLITSADATAILA